MPLFEPKSITHHHPITNEFDRLHGIVVCHEFPLLIGNGLHFWFHEQLHFPAKVTITAFTSMVSGAVDNWPMSRGLYESGIKVHVNLSASIKWQWRQWMTKEGRDSLQMLKWNDFFFLLLFLNYSNVGLCVCVCCFFLFRLILFNIKSKSTNPHLNLVHLNHSNPFQSIPIHSI